MTMSNIVQHIADKAPAILGGGILGVSACGLAFAAWGLTLTFGGEIIAAAVGMAVISRAA